MSRAFGALALLVLAPATARAAEPSPWSDSERLGDLVYFGMYGGVSFASVGTLTHVSDENASSSVAEDVTAPVSFAVGYDVAWWPYDFVGLDGSFEVFGLPLTAGRERFDDCDGQGCRRELTPDYDGFGMQVGPTVRGAVPLRFVQPNVGIGVQLPVTAQFTQDPVSRLDQTSFEVAAALRAAGGVNAFVARDWRIYGEYHLDYRLASVAPGEPLDNEGLMRHSIVLGFAVSPDSFKELPSGEGSTAMIVPLTLPTAAWILAAVFKGTDQ